MNTIFMGTPEMAIPTLQSLVDFGCNVQAVYTQPERPVGRKKQLIPSPVRAFAESHQFPVHTPAKVNTAEELDRLRQLAPDLIVVCAFGQILPQALLDLPKLGCFNLHFSFLPRWRGASPIQAAIREGDVSTGVSLQKMVMKLDAGPLVAHSAPVTIQANDTYETLGNRLSLVSGALLQEILPRLENQRFVLKEQDPANITFCKIIKKEEGRVLWHEQTALEIERRLRAYTPWPGTYSIDRQGKRLQFMKVQVLNERYPPGILSPEGIIGANDGAIQVLELKPEGKAVMSTEDFLRGHLDLIGTELF
ncbi:methionyl-tRNA formyltransferase [Deltaproteobacteria bacterium TL4]